jgi:hypothetical protein
MEIARACGQVISKIFPLTESMVVQQWHLRYNVTWQFQETTVLRQHTTNLPK